MNAHQISSTSNETYGAWDKSWQPSITSERSGRSNSKKTLRVIKALRAIKNRAYLDIVSNTQVTTKIVDLTLFREQKNSKVLDIESFDERPYIEGVRKDLRRQMAKIRNVSANWDGMGAQAPDQNVLHTASYLIDKWSVSTSISTEICPLSDGSICFEFYDQRNNLIGALDLFNDGYATYAFTSGTTISDAGEIDINDDSQLITLFNRLKNT